MIDNGVKNKIDYEYIERELKNEAVNLKPYNISLLECAMSLGNPKLVIILLNKGALLSEVCGRSIFIMNKSLRKT
jgi:hypothetical protein